MRENTEKIISILGQILHGDSESSLKIQGFTKAAWYPKLDPKTSKQTRTLVDKLVIKSQDSTDQ